MRKTEFRRFLHLWNQGWRFSELIKVFSFFSQWRLNALWAMWLVLWNRWSDALFHFSIFCLLSIFLSFDQMAPFLQSMSLFTPTYTVHDGAGNEKFIVQVILSSKSFMSFYFDLFCFWLFAFSPQGPSSMSCFKSCCECCRTRDVIFRCCFIAPLHLKLCHLI